MFELARAEGDDERALLMDFNEVMGKVAQNRGYKRVYLLTPQGQVVDLPKGGFRVTFEPRRGAAPAR